MLVFKGGTMKVYELVKTIGYTRNILEHFKFCIVDPTTEEIIDAGHISEDEFVELCGRKVLEWMPEEYDDDFIGITIFVEMKKFDVFKFRRG
jgi:hypothetical protein